MARSALLVGATGLVGGRILERLVTDDTFDDVRLVTRRPLDKRLPAKARVFMTDFHEIDPGSEWLDVDVVFSAMGTTLRQAGSKDAFRRVDFEIPHRIAELTRAQGATHLLLVSSLSADARSRVFYSRVKGELEDAVLKLGYPTLTIARPSVLVGPRAEPRWGERLMKSAGFFLPDAWKPVEVRKVAAALLRSAREEGAGVRILDNATLRRESA